MLLVHINRSPTATVCRLAPTYSYFSFPYGQYLLLTGDSARAAQGLQHRRGAHSVCGPHIWRVQAGRGRDRVLSQVSSHGNIYFFDIFDVLVFLILLCVVFWWSFYLMVVL